MIIAGNTQVLVRGRITRVLSSRFNRALRAALKRGEENKFQVRDVSGKLLIPSKGMEWTSVAEQIRQGKKAQAKTEAKASAKTEGK